ncbi:hypothetical protein FQN50_002523 [Emmonsiellopsis sp. PD_5]|nr:hypothetical protein FQN50_002523 [Emmonsiellopsis sp. PD_5]
MARTSDNTENHFLLLRLVSGGQHYSHRWSTPTTPSRLHYRQFERPKSSSFVSFSKLPPELRRMVYPIETALTPSFGANVLMQPDSRAVKTSPTTAAVAHFATPAPTRTTRPVPKRHHAAGQPNKTSPIHRADPPQAGLPELRTGVPVRVRVWGQQGPMSGPGAVRRA